MNSAEDLNTKKLSTLEWSDVYDGLSWSTIVVKPHSKHPAQKWAGNQTHKATHVERETWWGKGSQNNIGIVTGEISGLVVFDCDSPRGHRLV